MADVKKIRVDIDGNARGLKNATSQANKSLDGLGGTAKKLGGLIAGAFAVGAITNFAKEAFRAAAVAEGVEKAFNKLGVSLNQLKRATRGTVDEFKLMQSAVQASNLGVPVQQLATLFEFAQKRAEETGESVEYLTQSIVTGIGRKSVLILDNLGLSSIRINNEFRKMGDFGAAVGKIVREELSKMGDTSETAATKIQKTEAAFEDLKGRIGEFLTGPGSGFLTWLDGVIKEADEFIQLVQIDGLGLTELQKKFLLGAETADQLSSSIETYENQLRQAREEAQRMKKVAFSKEATDEQVAAYNMQVEKIKEINRFLKVLRNRHDELKAAEDAAAKARDAALAKELRRLREKQNLLRQIEKEAPMAEGVGAFSDPADMYFPSVDEVKSRMQLLGEALKEFSEKRKETAKEAAEYEKNIEEELGNEKRAIAMAGLAASSTIASAVLAMQRSKMNKELEAAGDNEKKKNEIRKKYAQKEKEIAIIQSIINTALAVTGALPNIPLSIAVGAAGAIQTALIASQQFARGTSFAPGGMALVGEQGPEIVNLPKGASVTPNHQLGGGMGGGDIVLKVNEYEFARIINVATANQGNNVARTTF